MRTTAGRKEGSKGGRLTDWLAGRTDMQNANEEKEEEVALLTFWKGREDGRTAESSLTSADPSHATPLTHSQGSRAEVKFL